jgi:4-amino-4-deoxy-L-arabinose transferase-like glycosyltransferase
LRRQRVMAESGEQGQPRRPSPGWVIAAAAAVLWLFLVLGAYYAVHKPFEVTFLRAFLGSGAEVLGWLACLLVAAGLGHILAGRLPPTVPLERLIFSVTLGLAAISFLTLALGLVGLLYRGLFIVLLLVASGALWPQYRPLLADCWPVFREAPRPRFEKALLLYLAFALLVTFLWALAPPYAWDSLVYHLHYPELYAQSHSVVVPVDSPYVAYPGLLSMLFTVGLLLGSGVIAKLFHFTYLLLVLLLLYVFAGRYFTRRVGWLAMAILASSFSILMLSAAAYVDTALMFHGLLVFYALSRWREEGGRRWLVFAGLAAGLAMGFKYTAFPIPLGAALLVLLSSQTSEVSETSEVPLKEAAANLFIFGLAAGVVAVPWYLKNWLLAGNPIYPYLFGGVGWDAFRSSWLDRPGTGLAGQPLRLLLAPLEMTIYGIEGREGYSATLGPLFLATVPLLALTWRKMSAGERAFLWRAGLFCLVQYAFWLFGVARSALLLQGRLLFPIFPLLALLGAWGLERLRLLDTPTFSPSWLGRAVVAIVLGLEVITLGLLTLADHPWGVIVGLESRPDYVGRHVGTAYAAALNDINEELPAEADVLFLWEPRSYGCRRHCRPDTILDNFMHLAYLHHDAPTIAAHLRETGVSHVLLYQRGLDVLLESRFDPIADADLRVLHTLQKDHLTLLHDYGGAYLLYEVIE